MKRIITALKKGSLNKLVLTSENGDDIDNCLTNEYSELFKATLATCSPNAIEELLLVMQAKDEHYRSAVTCILNYLENHNDAVNKSILINLALKFLRKTQPNKDADSYQRYRARFYNKLASLTTDEEEKIRYLTVSSLNYEAINKKTDQECVSICKNIIYIFRILATTPVSFDELELLPDIYINEDQLRRAFTKNFLTLREISTQSICMSSLDDSESNLLKEFYYHCHATHPLQEKLFNIATVAFEPMEQDSLYQLGRDLTECSIQIDMLTPSDEIDEIKIDCKDLYLILNKCVQFRCLPNIPLQEELLKTEPNRQLIRMMLRSTEIKIDDVVHKIAFEEMPHVESEYVPSNRPS